MIAFQIAETDYLRMLAISKMEDGVDESKGHVESLYTSLVRLLVAKGALLPDMWDINHVYKQPDTAGWLRCVDVSENARKN